MDVFEADYSNLFAAGLRGIQSRSTDPDRSPSELQLHPDLSSSIGAGSADHDQDAKRVKFLSVPSSFWKSFLLSTRLWRRPSLFPRTEKTSSAVRNLTAWSNAASRAARRQSIPSDVVEESSLKLRILDWSSHVSNAMGALDEEDESEDPYLFDEVDPVDVPASTPTKILLTLPSSASFEEQEISSALEQHDHRMSLQALPMHMMLPSLPYRSFFSSDDETTWETASASSSEDESGLDDVWDQFRVEWIDFDGTH